MVRKEINPKSTEKQVEKPMGRSDSAIEKQMIDISRDIPFNRKKNKTKKEIQKPFCYFTQCRNRIYKCEKDTVDENFHEKKLYKKSTCIRKIGKRHNEWTEQFSCYQRINF